MDEQPCPYAINLGTPSFIQHNIGLEQLLFSTYLSKYVANQVQNPSYDKSLNLSERKRMSTSVQVSNLELELSYRNADEVRVYQNS